MKLKKIRSEKERFMEKVMPEPNSGCWIWMAGLTSAGYGHFYPARGIGSSKAPRVAYRLFVGTIPAGMELDHLCRTILCVNPAHLEPVTHQENILRSPLVGRAKTHCKQGHEYTLKNTYWRPSGRRSCRICHSISERNRRALTRSREELAALERWLGQ